MLDAHAHVMQVKLCKANTRGVTFSDLRDTISSGPLIDDVCWHENVRHDVVASRCLVLVDDV